MSFDLIIKGGTLPDGSVALASYSEFDAVARSGRVVAGAVSSR